MTVLHLNCKKCNKEFKFEVGRIKINKNQKIDLQKDAYCPYCKESSKEMIELTEKNKQILSQIYDKQERAKTIRNYFPGKLVGYPIIFGREYFIPFQFDSQNYYVVDNYCVLPKCACKEVLIDFYKKINEKKSAELDLLFRFNYFNKEILEVNTIKSEKAIEQINSFLQDYQESFESRHKELKAFMGEIAKKKEDIIEHKSKKLSRKVGRNEPCPCGSGKKYKKCCINKEDQ